MHAIPAQVLDLLYAKLTTPLRYGRPMMPETARGFAKKGWITVSHMEDVVEYMDNRITPALMHGLMKAFDFTPQHIGKCPGRLSAKSNVMLFLSLTAVDFAAFLCVLEYLGFYVNATRMVEAVAPSLTLKKKWLTDNEFTVLWHKMPGTQDTQLVREEPASKPDHVTVIPETTNEFKTLLGYTVSSVHKNGHVTRLCVSGPHSLGPGVRPKTKSNTAARAQQPAA